MERKFCQPLWEEEWIRDEERYMGRKPKTELEREEGLLHPLIKGYLAIRKGLAHPRLTENGRRFLCQRQIELITEITKDTGLSKDLGDFLKFRNMEGRRR